MTVSVPSDVAILAYAAALPTLRLPATAYAQAWGACSARGLRQKAACAYDEDAVTLAVAAARALGLEHDDWSALVVGATTLPYDEKPAAATIATALTDRRDPAVLELRGSPLAGLQALAVAVDHCRAHPGRRALAIAADAPTAALDAPLEHGLGAGAAAFLVGPGRGCATVANHWAVTRETFGGRARRRGAPEVHDPDLRTDDVGPAVADLVGAMPQAATTAARLALGGTAAEARRVARTIGGKPAQVSQLFAEIGDAGAAAAPLALCDALDSAAAGEVVLAVAVGSGAVALRLEVADVPAAGRRGRAVAEQARGGREVDYVAYLRHGRRLSSFKGDAA